MMVSESRDAVGLSSFLTWVADMGESIEQSSEAAERLPGSPYHSTPKQAAPETGAFTREARLQSRERPTLLQIVVFVHERYLSASATGALEFAHDAGESLDSLDSDGVVERGQDDSDGAMPGGTGLAGRLGLLFKCFFN